MHGFALWNSGKEQERARGLPVILFLLTGGVNKQQLPTTTAFSPSIGLYWPDLPCEGLPYMDVFAQMLGRACAAERRAIATDLGQFSRRVRILLMTARRILY